MFSRAPGSRAYGGRMGAPALSVQLVLLALILAPGACSSRDDGNADVALEAGGEKAA